VATLFISDLHIDAHSPAITAQFLKFLRDAAPGVATPGADAVYILGDLFDAWIGDDAPDSAQRQAIDGLRALTDSGVPCYVMQGNRDFLYGPEFCAASGARLLHDPVILTLYGERVLTLHGDALCTDDRAYQKLRATVRDPDWQSRFLALSAAKRRSIAAAARSGSQAHTATLDYAIADVSPASVAAVMRAAGTSVLLHGHTHRPGIHEFDLDGRACRRIVLGDWHAGGSVLRWDAAGPKLLTLAR
jgi:UDP-2,3-diacylglucosamine hydrolase